MGKVHKLKLIHPKTFTTDEKIIHYITKAHKEMLDIYRFCLENDIYEKDIEQAIIRMEEAWYWYERFSDT